MESLAKLSAASAGTVDVGGDLTVNRLGLGAMRLTGPGIWGEPPDREVSKAVLRRAVELGVNFIDTADSYGPAVSETLIAEALYPYPEDVVIATKGGSRAPGSERLVPERATGASEGRVRRQPPPAPSGPDPVVPAPSSGPEGALRGVGRRARRAEGPREDPPHRGFQRDRGRPAPSAARDAGRLRAEPLQPRRSGIGHAGRSL